MLVLTRSLGQEIVIDGNITVVVLDVKGDRVRLGIDAPPSVSVDRKEIYERRQSWKKAVSVPVPPLVVSGEPVAAL